MSKIGVRRVSHLAVLSAAVFFAAGCTHSAARTTMIPKDQAIMTPASQLQWKPMAGLPGAMQVALWGDIDKGEHGALYRWPAGTNAPLHWHTHGDHGVIVSGTLTLAKEGQAPVELPPGSFFSLGGGMKHATSCKAGADCVFFIHREGKFDATMVESAPK